MSLADSPEKALPSEQCEHTHLESLVAACTAVGGKLKAVLLFADVTAGAVALVLSCTLIVLCANYLVH